MIELELPWPDRALHPNSRGHWAKRAKAAKAARIEAWAATMTSGGKISLDAGQRLRLYWHFCPPDNRKRDDDGLLSSCKNWRDGIADAIGIDDNRFITYPPTFGNVTKGGLVRVRIVPEGA